MPNTFLQQLPEMINTDGDESEGGYLVVDLLREKNTNINLYLFVTILVT